MHKTQTGMRQSSKSCWHSTRSHCHPRRSWRWLPLRSREGSSFILIACSGNVNQDGSRKVNEVTCVSDQCRKSHSTLALLSSPSTVKHFTILCSQHVSWLHFLPGSQFCNTVWTLSRNLNKEQLYCKSSEKPWWNWACSSTRIALVQCVCRCFNVLPQQCKRRRELGGKGVEGIAK